MMKFIVDAMLGRLARWLRILGYDTIYDANFTDDDLFFKAHQEKRILLTRDAGLAQRMNPQYCFFITDQVVQNQVKQVIKRFHLNTEEHLFTRCTLCNDIVSPMSKQFVAGRVPDFVFHSSKEFYFCERCDKIYWAGSHIRQVRELLSKLSAEQKND